jgi:hypothetical protein
MLFHGSSSSCFLCWNGEGVFYERTVNWTWNIDIQYPIIWVVKLNQRTFDNEYIKPTIRHHAETPVANIFMSINRKNSLVIVSPITNFQSTSYISSDYFFFQKISFNIIIPSSPHSPKWSLFTEGFRLIYSLSDNFRCAATCPIHIILFNFVPLITLGPPHEVLP